MTTITFIGPMCGFVKMPQIKKPFEVTKNCSSNSFLTTERIRSWSNENEKYYETIGCHHCSCKAFKYGKGKLCKHLIAKSATPRVVIGNGNMDTWYTGKKNSDELYRTVQNFSGIYKYLGTFNFPVWVLNRPGSSSVYLFKGRKYNRWMLSDTYSGIFNERGLISTKKVFPSDSVIPPNDILTTWRIWCQSKQKWVCSYDVVMTMQA